MSFDAETLYNLLPAIYRIRDGERGKPLFDLISAIAREVGVLEEDLAQLYDDLFIETCADWVIPYIGDLVGDRALYKIANSSTTTANRTTPRAVVANTIAYRRRKGTASILEQLARDVTGWDARVVEFFQLLATTQYMNHLRPDRRPWLDLRNREYLENLNTAFERIPHTIDVRRIASQRGKYNIPNIGIFLWRLGSYSLTNSQAFKLSDRRYLFNTLGHNTQLFNKPETEPEITHIAEPINIAMPINRYLLNRYLSDYYGKDKSILIIRDCLEIPLDEIIVCDLSDKNNSEWKHQPQNKVAIDPVLGRIAFPETQPPPQIVYVIYHYGFSAPMGGGEYSRVHTFNEKLPLIVKVPFQFGTVQLALDELNRNIQIAENDSGIVEIGNSDTYPETPVINIPDRKQIEIRAADKCRPHLILNSDLLIFGKEESELTINGLLISGGSLKIPQKDLENNINQLKRLRLVHCTLVPGLTVTTDGTPQHPESPSLIIDRADIIVEIESCILGGLRVDKNAEVKISNSIVDATSDSEFAYTALDKTAAGGSLTIKNSTIIGQVHTVEMPLASNTIFGSELAKPVLVEKQQLGCVRFCYLNLNYLVPPRYNCQPKTTEDAALIYPQFTSTRYGDAAYYQLSQRCAIEIRQGADDRSEMGAFHDLYQAQRETNLRVRLDEYLRFGLEAGILYVT
ncbi:MAG TPA: hypothetical protein V6D28_23260 [Leptolyngbyaceae cyanobacterium]